MAAFTTHDILASIGLRVSSLKDGDTAAMEGYYTTRPLTTTQFEGLPFVFSACKDALSYAISEAQMVIANTAGLTWRRLLHGQTSTLTNGALLPNTDSNSKQIIGVWGSVRDAANSKVLTDGSLQQIDNINDSGAFLLDYYLYAFDVGRIQHTRSAGVKIDCCVQDMSAIRAAVDNNTAFGALLPDVLAAPVIAEACAFLYREDENFAQAATFKQYADSCWAEVRNGSTNIPVQKGAAVPNAGGLS